VSSRKDEALGEKNTYLVTGGAGFIGSHLAESLVTEGHDVRVLDNFLTGKKANLADFIGDIQLIEGDIRDFSTCERALAGVDYVLHQAALPSVPRSIEDPIVTNEINVSGTLNMLVASKNAKVQRFIFASSSSVYGDDPNLPKAEGMEGAPLSPYAASKIVGEKYCQVFSHNYGLETVSLRYFNVFGPRQDPDSPYSAVIPIFITKMKKGESPTIFGDGEQSRDFTFVQNVVMGNLLALKADHVSGEIINIACGERITVNTLFAKIRDFHEKDIDPVYEKPRQGDILHSFADITKANKMLGYEPAVSLDDGLENTIRWL
jgi:nucleoside-diphosphate-sugar epimerase